MRALANELGTDLFVLYEHDARFSTEHAPRLRAAALIVSPTCGTFVGSSVRYVYRGKGGHLRWCG